ncbi:response regulator [Streptomyces sp. NPDC006798]|uniref:response regulator n=1 Tax=Streptomyces sp. NPDC006798 TaxID=3155462 RepID=UPI00340CB274
MSEIMNSRVPVGHKPDGTPYRVLVVDDSLFVVKQMAQILGSEGFEVAATAVDGEDAVSKYKELFPNIDLVTMDITLPKMDGLTALEHIIKFDPKARVVMAAAIGSQEAVKKALIAGAKNYIVKPLDHRKIMERIASTLR